MFSPSTAQQRFHLPSHNPVLGQKKKPNENKITHPIVVSGLRYLILGLFNTVSHESSYYLCLGKSLSQLKKLNHLAGGSTGPGCSVVCFV